MKVHKHAQSVKQFKCSFCSENAKEVYGVVLEEKASSLTQGGYGRYSEDFMSPKYWGQ